MTGDSDADMRLLTLALMGEFAKVQDVIDALVGMYFERRTPGLQWYLKQKGVPARISDTDRPRLVSSIAEDLGTTGDLTNFRTTFERVKRVRDYAGHSVRIEMLDSDTILLKKQFVESAEAKLDPPVTVTRAELASHHRDVLWMLNHVQYIIGSSDLTVKTYLGDREIQALAPPANPEDWNEIGYVFVDEQTVTSTSAER
ncbi:hypothetical protein [Nocardia anaemiae]|uniref:hypothetical protein n=1 Tax=Nocardia anaemiae TaxID=263910 RepID=UPI0007A52E25|nr:hypothetical protein [Nocardia anaemiae]